jgi:hypothetical protein
MLRKKKTQMPVYSKKSYNAVINYNRVLDKKRVESKLPKASEENEFISQQVKLLLAKEINTDKFKESLTEKQIKIDSDPIKRNLNLIDQNYEVSYKEMMACLERFKNQDNKLEKFASKMESIKPTIAHQPSTSKLDVISKKKMIYVPTFESQKDIHDWEKNAFYDAVKRNEELENIKRTRPTSQVFNGTVNNTPSKSISRKNPNQNMDGEIIKLSSPKSKTVKKVEVNLHDDSYKKFATPNSTVNKKTKSISIYGYKNNSTIKFDKKPLKDSSSSLIRPASTKNLKLHMSSSDNFLASLKTASTSE